MSDQPVAETTPEQPAITDPIRCDEVCCGMNVPIDPWTEDDVRFWTGTATYQPWKDVAAFFREAPRLVAEIEVEADKEPEEA